MYDLTRYNTFEHLVEWLEIYKDFCKPLPQPIPVILVGSKLDLEEFRMVDKAAAEDFSKSQNLLEYIECSSKTGYNMELIFQTLAKHILSEKEIYESQTANR